MGWFPKELDLQPYICPTRSGSAKDNCTLLLFYLNLFIKSTSIQGQFLPRSIRDNRNAIQGPDVQPLDFYQPYDHWHSQDVDCDFIIHVIQYFSSEEESLPGLCCTE
jgi:hypothetical protein